MLALAFYLSLRWSCLEIRTRTVDSPHSGSVSVVIVGIAASASGASAGLIQVAVTVLRSYGRSVLTRLTLSVSSAIVTARWEAPPAQVNHLPRMWERPSSPNFWFLRRAFCKGYRRALLIDDCKTVCMQLIYLCISDMRATYCALIMGQFSVFLTSQDRSLET